MAELFVMEYMTVLGTTMVLLLLDSRYSRRRTILTVCSAMVPVMVAVAAIYRLAGLEATLKTYSLIAHIPSLLLFLTLSRFRGWRLIFQVLSAILFCMLIHHCAGLICYLLGNYVWVLLLSYVFLSAGVIWFLVCFLRPLFLQALLNLHHGWWLICLVLATYYVIIIYMIPGYVWPNIRPAQASFILKPAISLLMVGFYSILLSLFSSIRKEKETWQNAQLSALQLSALQSRMEAVKAAEAAIRTERHDLRHRLQTLTELVSRGDRDAALDFLDAAQKRLNEHKEIRWCRPPVLDAVFSSYFDQAKNQGIPVEAKIALPDPLPVNEGELAIVLANALENAIHANMELPQGQRKIRCKMVGAPGLMLEISNPCTGHISFDSNGLPLAQKEGHGLGIQSITAFCQRNGAVCQFSLTDGWFRLQLIL